MNYVQNDQKGKFIYVAKQKGTGWIADKRTIKTGKDYDGLVEVLEGINPGEKIVSAGFQNLNAGSSIVF